jgi:hypothetical protein
MVRSSRCSCLRRTERQVEGKRELGSRSASSKRAFVCAQVIVDAPNLETEDVIRCCLLRATAHLKGNSGR